MQDKTEEALAAFLIAGENTYLSALEAIRAALPEREPAHAEMLSGVMDDVKTRMAFLHGALAKCRHGTIQPLSGGQDKKIGS